MALRKEQVLVVVALVLGALVYKSGQDEGWRAPSLSPQSKDYKPAGAPGAPATRPGRSARPSPASAVR